MADRFNDGRCFICGDGPSMVAFFFYPASRVPVNAWPISLQRTTTGPLLIAQDVPAGMSVVTHIVLSATVPGARVCASHGREASTGVSCLLSACAVCPFDVGDTAHDGSPPGQSFRSHSSSLRISFTPGALCYGVVLSYCFRYMLYGCAGTAACREAVSATSNLWCSCVSLNLCMWSSRAAHVLYG